MTDDLHVLSGAYAMDAIGDTEERRRFESHLARCETCATEVHEFRATTARLGMAAAEPPPPGLRDRVLADIRHVRQLPPVTSRTPSAPKRPKAKRWRRVATAGLVGAACLVTAVSVTQVMRERQRVDRAEETARAVASVLSAPDRRSATGRATGGGTVTITASGTAGRVVVATSGLRALPSSKAYQLWLIDASGPRSAGLLPADRTRPVVAGTWRPADRVGLTIEPAGGSARPTTTPLVLLNPT
ncbi:anti-sigma-K factor RskA [Actinomadura pelletieri DSM 43383]|uniref:Regulator of SigK n=1 Tax=Actinomadura pelletieri DSM 43383 TaxID=1120940 RepID=A0A495QAV0_9ACTN|nr:anti-sigma factor [Actinomadura pelletieri]RKS68819.1 anti-sigma-K factor RskA [Actinomadura pelletieri DSM 43383]